MTLSTLYPPTPPPSYRAVYSPARRASQEENRLRAKALRAERDAASLAAGTAPPPRTSAGLVTTGDIQLAGRKRGHGAISRADVPAAHRDARTNNNSSGGEKGEGGGPLKAAKSFAKYVDYNFSAMTDTKGGFLSAEDDPRGRGGAPASGQVEKPAGVTAAQWEKEQLHRNLRRLKAGPYEPGLSVLAEEQDRKKCRECASLEIDFVWDEVFKTRVCNACKEKMPEKYSLLTKTEAKEDYLLTERTFPPSPLCVCVRGCWWLLVGVP